jgi:hypothetical protein
MATHRVHDKRVEFQVSATALSSGDPRAYFDWFLSGTEWYSHDLVICLLQNVALFRTEPIAPFMSVLLNLLQKS